MATEDDLRDMLGSATTPGPIDAGKVIARARARRLPRRIAVGAIGTLAVAAIAVVGIQTISRPPVISAMSQGAAAPSAETGQALDAAKRAPADRINLCEGPLAAPAPSFSGLRLDVDFPTSIPVGTNPVEGTVTIVNTSSSRVVGTTAAGPAMTLSRDGIVIWHSNGPADQSATVVDLAPGESLEYPASFTPVRCAVQDDEAEHFRPDLPAVPAGNYELSAAIDFLPDAAMPQQATPGLDLVTGPVAAIAIG